MLESEYTRQPGKPALDPTQFQNFGGQNPTLPSKAAQNPAPPKTSEPLRAFVKTQLSRTKPFEAPQKKESIHLSVMLNENITVYPPSGPLSVDLIDEFETFSKMMQREGYKKRSDALRLALAIGMLVCQGKWK